MNYLVLCRVIHDGVHGLIRLTAEEMKVIDHPLFQRQRWIVQTGLLRYVFPSANQTRFEHCLGALAMTQKLLDGVSRGSRSSDKKLYDLDQAMAGQAVKFHDLDVDSKAMVQRLARLCALVHDLGHGPFSHAFKFFAPKISQVVKLLDDPRLASLVPYHQAMSTNESARIAHEVATCILFAVLWNDVGGEPWTPAFVASVLLDQEPDAGIPQNVRPWCAFVRDMISSAPVDADRMDYMLRDSRAIGVNYGLYDVERILKAVLCVREDRGGNQAYRLGWRKSSLRAIEDFAQARFQMFAQIYRHKTLRASELMLRAITQEAEACDLVLVDTSSLDAMVEEYLDLSDEAFLRCLAKGERNGFDPNDKIKRLAKQLTRRQIWKRLYEFERSDHDCVDRVLAEVAQTFPQYRFHADRQPLKAMRDLERGAALLALDGSGRYSHAEYSASWIEASPIMRVLRDEERSIVRLFMETDERTSAAAPLARAAVLRLVNEAKKRQAA